jgi:hypothetical protein
VLRDQLVGYEGTAKAILQALTMSDDEASVRWEVRCM